MHYGEEHSADAGYLDQLVFSAVSTVSLWAAGAVELA